MAQYGNFNSMPYPFKRENLAEFIKEILSNSDLSLVTPKTVRGELCSRLGLTDLRDRRSEINILIRDLINTVPAHCRKAIKDYYNRYSRSLTAGIDTSELEVMLSNAYYSSLNISVFTSKSGLNLSLSDISSAGSSSNSESSNSITGGTSTSAGTRRNFDTHYRVFNRPKVPDSEYSLSDEFDDTPCLSTNNATTTAKPPSVPQDSSAAVRLPKSSKLLKNKSSGASAAVKKLLPQTLKKQQLLQRTAVKKPVKIFDSATKPEPVKKPIKIFDSATKPEPVSLQLKKKKNQFKKPITVTSVSNVPNSKSKPTTTITSNCITTTTAITTTSISTNNTITTSTINSVPNRHQISTNLQSSLLDQSISGTSKVGVIIKSCQPDLPTAAVTSAIPQQQTIPANYPKAPIVSAVPSLVSEPTPVTESFVAPNVSGLPSSTTPIVPKSPTNLIDSNSGQQVINSNNIHLYSKLQQLSTICELSQKGHKFDLNDKPQLIFWKKVLRDTAYQYYNLSGPDDDEDEDDEVNLQNCPPVAAKIDQSDCSNDENAQPVLITTSTPCTTTTHYAKSPSHKSNTKSPNKLQIIDLSSNYPTSALADTAQYLNFTKTSQSPKNVASIETPLNNSHKHKSKTEPRPRCNCGQVEVASIRSLNSDSCSSGSSVQESLRSSTIHSYNGNQDNGSASSSVPTVGHEITYQSESDMEQFSFGLDQNSEPKKPSNYGGSDDGGSQKNGDSKQYRLDQNNMGTTDDNNGCSALEIRRPMSDSSEVVYSVTSSLKQHQQKKHIKRKRSISASGDEQSDDEEDKEESSEEQTYDEPNKLSPSACHNVNTVGSDGEEPYNNFNRQSLLSPLANNNSELLANNNYEKRTFVGTSCAQNNSHHHIQEQHNYNAVPKLEHVQEPVKNNRELSLDEIIQNDQELARRLQQEEYMAARPARRRMAIVACSRLHEQFSRSPQHFGKTDDLEDDEVLINLNLDDDSNPAPKKRKYRRNSSTTSRAKSRSCSPNKVILKNIDDDRKKRPSSTASNTIIKIKRPKKIDKMRNHTEDEDEEERKRRKLKRKEKRLKRKEKKKSHESREEMEQKRKKHRSNEVQDEENLSVKKKKKILNSSTSSSKPSLKPRSRSESEDKSNDGDESERIRREQRRKERKTLKKEPEERKEHARNRESEQSEESSSAVDQYDQLQKLSPRMAQFLGHSKLSINDISSKLLRYIFKKGLFFESGSRIYVHCDQNLSKLFGIADSFRRDNLIKLIRQNIINDLYE